MTRQAIRSRSLSEQVFEQLASAIVTGKYPAGGTLPAERTLTGVFGVNRHVVREALKRLEQVGLVKVSQGGGTRILDFKRSAGLDLLALMSEYARGGADVAAIWLAVFEMRSAIGADVARLCALRGSRELKAKLVATAERMASTGDDEERFELEIAFWEIIADGADNIAYRLALNSMIKSVMGDEARIWVLEDLKHCEFRIPIARAIADGDGARAEAVTRDVMRGGIGLLASTLGFAATPAKGESIEKSGLSASATAPKTAGGSARVQARAPVKEPRAPRAPRASSGTKT